MPPHILAYLHSNDNYGGDDQVSKSESSCSEDVLSHMARNVTMWEFLNMKVNRSLQRPQGRVRIANMLTELEDLHRHYKQLAKDELRPVPCDTEQPSPASKILVVSWHCRLFDLEFAV